MSGFAVAPTLIDAWARQATGNPSPVMRQFYGELVEGVANAIIDEAETKRDGAMSRCP